MNRHGRATALHLPGWPGPQARGPDDSTFNPGHPLPIGTGGWL